MNVDASIYGRCWTVRYFIVSERREHLRLRLWADMTKEWCTYRARRCALILLITTLSECSEIARCCFRSFPTLRRNKRHGNPPQRTLNAMCRMCFCMCCHRLALSFFLSLWRVCTYVLDRNSMLLPSLSGNCNSRSACVLCFSRQYGRQCLSGRM